MGRALVKLTYRQVIDASSTDCYELEVFRVTYDEYKLYNTEGKFKTFTELKTNDGTAKALQQKLRFAAGHLVEGLNYRMPELVDNLGNTVEFETATFELIASDVNNPAAHKVAINYHTGMLTLCDTIGDYLVLAKREVLPGQADSTFVLKLQPKLSITEFHVQDQSIRSTFVPILKHNN